VVATHFSQIPPNVAFLQITPVEKVRPMVPTEYTFMGMLDISERIKFHKMEQFWIKHLNTLNPYSLNEREELAPPIPFCIR